MTSRGERDSIILPPLTSLGGTFPYPDTHVYNKENVSRFLALEGRMNELHDQIQETQQMIRDLAEIIMRRPSYDQDSKKQRTSSREWSSGLEEMVEQQEKAELIASNNQIGRTASDIILPSNPVALQKHSEVNERLSLTMGKPSKSKTIPSVDSMREDHVLTRHFSINQLSNPKPTQSMTNISRAIVWSRKIFRLRNSSVSPQEIVDARSGDSKIHPMTILHDSTRRSVWDAFVMSIVLIDITCTPLSLSFLYTPREFSYFNYIATIVFGTDFIINLLSSYTSERGELVTGPRYTIQHYLCSYWAIPDFLGWFPFEYMVNANQSRVLSIAKVIRLAKISQLARRMHSVRGAGVLRFIRLFGIVFLVSHILTCYWNWVATVWRYQEAGYLEKSLSEKYAHCWALVIGSLNASPPTMYTPIEELSVAIFMLIGNVIQASVFGAVAAVISSFDEADVEYNKKLISTYERCKFLDIPEPLARRIQGYYINLYRETRSVNTDADAFINELSPALICEVKFQLYRDMITRIPFLSANDISPIVIEMLILHLRTVIYMQDDVLIRKGEYGDWMGFIGTKGSVGVLDPNTNRRTIIRILRKGDYFGEMALLQLSKRSTTAVALSWVQIHVLCRRDLNDVKDQYPEEGEHLEKEIIKYMKSKVTYK